MDLDPYNWEIILTWNENKKYKDPVYTFKVRDRNKNANAYGITSHSQIPKIALPKEAWGDILRWCLQENVPGEYPFTAGLYPFKRAGEDPSRMFAGEGGPERTNKRFHYVSAELPNDCQRLLIV
jgi:methylmalonyl-CoA mutase